MITAPAETGQQKPVGRWYAGVTSYQWLMLAIASAGWIFDAFEGQIFNLTRNQMLADILHVGTSAPVIKDYGDKLLAIFLIGGTVGGLLFGSLADKWGRRPTMAITILMYSVFSGLTFFATNLWQVGLLRFLVAMGVGGEWAVAASLVAEIFPPQARAHASGIFHATSVLGIWTAALAALAVGAQWRYGYIMGIVPALLILWVRKNVKEPESWVVAEARATRGEGPKMGSFGELLLDPRWSRRAILGMLLAAVGLGSFWGVTVAGQDLVRELLLRNGLTPAEAAPHAQKAYGIIETAGGLLGLLAFGPLCVRLGRRRAFGLMHLGAFLIVPITCYLPSTYWQLLMILPVFGFLTLGIHAGYAIYFPELFPAHLRGTGTGFCFNGGRILAASILVLSGWLKSLPGMDLRLAITLLALLFPLGLVIICFLPETKGQPLPE
ncbi:MAG: major facilitator superfamily 1 [Pedosphaera sp.]|nr:major facilitator superfamily 1 [Pedosphaera sp.]